MILLAGLGLACLPTILIWVLIVVLFLVILYIILGRAPEPIGSNARWVVLVLGLIILLWMLIQFAVGGVRMLC